ncbi:MAG: hypothetical protein MUC43_19975 [Pirellula sp.]|nr:hypothetical protein [Pirellula sp.]
MCFSKLTKCVWLASILYASASPVLSGEFERFRDIAISNAQCIRQFDVSLSLEVIDLDEPDLEFRHTCRMALDLDKNLGFCAVMSQRRLVSEEAGSKKSSRYGSAEVMAGISDSKNCVVRGFGGNSNMFRGDLHSVLYSCQIYDPRCIGIVNFPSQFPALKESDGFELLVKQRTQPIGLPERSEVKDGIVRVTHTEPNGRREYRYNAATLVPERITIYTEVNGSLHPCVEEIYTWEEKEGIMLPVRVVCEKSLPNGANGTKSESYCSAELTWRSLNRPLDEKLLDSKMISDVSKIVDLIKE